MTAGLSPVYGNERFRRPFVVARSLLNMLTCLGRCLRRKALLGFTTHGKVIRGYQRVVSMASIRESIGLDAPDIRSGTACRYVEGCASRSGFFWTGKNSLMFRTAFGFPMDPEKSVGYSILMVVLGIDVDLR